MAYTIPGCGGKPIGGIVPPRTLILYQPHGKKTYPDLANLAGGERIGPVPEHESQNFGSTYIPEIARKLQFSKVFTQAEVPEPRVFWKTYIVDGRRATP